MIPTNHAWVLSTHLQFNAIFLLIVTVVKVNFFPWNNFDAFIIYIWSFSLFVTVANAARFMKLNAKISGDQVSADENTINQRNNSCQMPSNQKFQSLDLLLAREKHLFLIFTYFFFCLVLIFIHFVGLSAYLAARNADQGCYEKLNTETFGYGTCDPTTNTSCALR